MTKDTSSVAAHPPKPRLVFRVGVVGHRPTRLKSADLPALSDRIGEVLAAVHVVTVAFSRTHAHLFSSEPLDLRAVTPLAEGTDRIFAEAALDHGFALCCPMPFVLDDFEEDFVPPTALTPDALDRFRSILERARKETSVTKFEMDGDPDHRPEAYGACGQVVLNQSDLLLVVWDGDRLGMRGGTEETFDAARTRGIPIVWMDAHAPHDWQVLDAASKLPREQEGVRLAPARLGAAARVESLTQAVRHALALPEDRGARPRKAWDKAGPTTVDDFYTERLPRLTPPLWRWFRDLLGYTTDRPEQTEHEGPRKPADPVYEWPNQLAVHYGDTYRSAFVFVYLLAGLAVGMALLPLAAGWTLGEPHVAETLTIVAELAMITAILLVVFPNRGWHDRWIDYRLAAELVRHLRLITPLGGQRPFPQVPAHLASYGQPASTWMAWYIRAVERDLGLPNVSLTTPYLRQCVSDLLAVLRDQIDFHKKTAARSERIEGRLHVVGLTLLGATLAACAVHLWLGVAASEGHSVLLIGNLVFLCGFLPALGAALAGIVNQGEFQRIAMRSKAMRAQLAILLTKATALEEALSHPALPGSEPPSRAATELATTAAQLMVNEVLDWRVVFLDRPLTPPS